MIALAVDGTIATITLDQPAARNALRIADWHQLADAVRSASGARVIVLRGGAGGTFCAGADIAEMSAFAHDAGARPGFRAAMRAGLDAVAGAPAPVIAFIDGGCFGAAVALAAAADIRVASAGARFAITPARLGIGYPPADVARIVALIGRGQAARLLLSAAAVDAAEAARIGLVDLVADDPLPLAHAIAQNAPAAVALLRRTIAGKASDADFDAAFGGGAFVEGLAAFRDRRTPRF